MISGDGVTEVSKTVGVLDVGDCWKCFLNALEEWRLVDVGTLILPLVLLSFRSLEFVPSVSSLGDFAIDVLEHVWSESFLDNFSDFII